MSSQVLVIAELGSTWRFGNDERENVRRGIRAAKDCDANILKMQWCSDGRALAKRRGESEAAGEMYAKYLEWPREWMQEFKEFADEVGIEWACTAFLPQDVSVIAPLVKRFKVARKEANDEVLREAIEGVSAGRQVIVSATNADQHCWGIFHSPALRCVSKYPCPLEELNLRGWGGCPGLSDHTGHVLTGAVAVGAGARVIEVHFKLGGFRSLVVGAGLPYERVHNGTPEDNPDFPHSHIEESLRQYVQNIRLAERMCG